MVLPLSFGSGFEPILSKLSLMRTTSFSIYITTLCDSVRPPCLNHFQLCQFYERAEVSEKVSKFGFSRYIFKLCKKSGESVEI